LKWDKALGLHEIDISIKEILWRRGRDSWKARFDCKATQWEELAASLEVAGPEGFHAHAKIQSAVHSDRKSRFALELNAKQGWEVNSNLNALVDWKVRRIEFTGNASIRRLAPWIREVRLENLSVLMNSEPELGAEVEVNLDSPKGIRFTGKTWTPAKWQRDLKGALQGRLLKGEYVYTLNLKSVGEGPLQGMAKVEGVLPYRLQQVHALVRIAEFQRLVQKWKGTAASIPAPFSVLGGEVALEIGSESQKVVDNLIPFRVSTVLKSKEQVLNTTSDGSLSMGPSLDAWELRGETELKNIRVSLPQFELFSSQPRLKGDPRIISMKERQEAELSPSENQLREDRSVFPWSWRFHSKPGAVRVNQDYFKPTLPLEVDIACSNARTSGSVKVLPVNLVILSREARVESFRFNLGNASPGYEGEVSVKRTNHKVLMKISERSGMPKVDLSSEPPLDKTDVLSVLLYNQTTRELNPDNSTSVAETRSALANKAIGLFSVIALSSTPIDAVTYDANTGVYSARVKISDGLTATIGTNWDKTQTLAFRKRLGKNFVLSTLVESNSDSDSNSGKTLLEWVRRY
jgi:hypothetical protein